MEDAIDLFSFFFSFSSFLFVGVAVGAGWQFSVALLNVACYYVIGLPIGAVLGYKLNLGVQGIWWAMLGGSLLQTIVLLIIIIRTNWLKEVRFLTMDSPLCQIMPLYHFLKSIQCKIAHTMVPSCSLFKPRTV